MNLKSPAVAIILMSLFTSCATLVTGSKNTVNIRTDPPNADISILDRKGKEIYTGKSQATIQLKTGAGYFVPAKYTVKINYPGYQERIVEIKSTINGWYFANIFIGGAIGMVFVDPATGAMWRLKDKIIDEKLDKKNSITGMKLQITDIRNLPDSEKTGLIRIQ